MSNKKLRGEEKARSDQIKKQANIWVSNGSYSYKIGNELYAKDLHLLIGIIYGGGNVQLIIPQYPLNMNSFASNIHKSIKRWGFNVMIKQTVDKKRN